MWPCDNVLLRQNEPKLVKPNSTLFVDAFYKTLTWHGGYGHQNKSLDMRLNPQIVGGAQRGGM